MRTPLKILTVVDWYEPGQWIWGHLPAQEDHYDIVSFSGVHAPSSWLEKATLYRFRYFLAGLRTLPLLDHYDVVFSWEIKCGLVIALYQTLLRRRRPRHVILGFILKGALARYPAAARLILSSAAGVVCFTRYEGEWCRNSLGLHPEQIHFIPLAWDVTEDADVSATDWDDYVLSVGSSNRDYKTLLQVATHVKARFIIVAQPYNLKGQSLPSNVEVRFNLSSNEVTRLLRRARLVIVPLHDMAYAAGQNVVLRAMSASRAVIVTRTPGTEDYVKDGETGILVSPNNVEETIKVVERLLGSPKETQQLGTRARQ